MKNERCRHLQYRLLMSAKYLSDFAKITERKYTKVTKAYYKNKMQCIQKM